MGLVQLHGWPLILKLGLYHFVYKRNWVWAGDIRRDTEFEKHHTIFEESFFAVFMDYDHQIEGLVPNTQKQFWYPWDSATFGTKIFEFRESRFFPKPRTPLHGSKNGQKFYISKFQKDDSKMFFGLFSNYWVAFWGNLAFNFDFLALFKKWAKSR